MKLQINYVDDIASRLNYLGRSEDIAISPDDSRIALAAFNGNHILLLWIHFNIDGHKKEVDVTDYLEIYSDEFKEPHGICWIDDCTIAVASRGASVIILTAPKIAPKDKKQFIDPISRIDQEAQNITETPGSVASHNIGSGISEMLVCNTFANSVSSHIISKNEQYKSLSNSFILRTGISTPDCVAFSKDGNLIAISNHSSRQVQIYKKAMLNGSDASPVATLNGMAFPHGLLFLDNDTKIFVADGGAPFLHVYENRGEPWSGIYLSTQKIRVFSDETFRIGNYNPAEGGPKGLSSTSDERFVAVSCYQRPLIILDTSKIYTPCAAVSPQNYSENRNSRLQNYPEVFVRHLTALSNKCNYQSHQLEGLINRINRYERELHDINQLHNERDYKLIISRLKYLEVAVYLTEVTNIFDLIRLKFNELINTSCRVLNVRVSSLYEMREREQVFADLYLNMEKCDTFCNNLHDDKNVYIDITSASLATRVTGISRVTMEFARSAMVNGAIPVCHRGNKVYKWNSTSKNFDPIKFHKNDIYLFADASWVSARTRIIIDQLLRTGTKIIFFVQDIIPITHSLFCPPDFVKTFLDWINADVLKADVVICGSRVSAITLEDYINAQGISKKDRPEIKWQHWGVSGVFLDPPPNETTRYKYADNTSTTTFISVGTIEPRKNYNTILDAFDIIWSQGYKVNCYIIGSYGWSSEVLKDRILSHFEYGNQLFWLQSCEDYELVELYRISRSLIFASFVEGFGLPILEAAALGLPLILSDIAVFREIAKDQADYFNPLDRDHLSRLIVNAIHTKKSPPDIDFNNWMVVSDKILKLCSLEDDPTSV